MIKEPPDLDEQLHDACGHADGCHLDLVHQLINQGADTN